LIPRKYDQTGFDAWLTQEDGPEWIENWVKKHLGDAYGVICSEGTNDPSGKALAILYKKDMIPVAKKSHYGLKNQFSDNIFTRDLQEVHFQIRSQRDPSKVENLVVLNSHFYANLKHNRYGEQRQKREYLQTADIIQEILKADPNTHIAAMGDFNLPTDHRQRKDLLNILTDDGNAMVDSFMKHHMAVPTCRSKMEGSTFHSDCILLTPTLDANVQDLGVIGNFDTEDKYQKSSPHLPVFVATNTSIPRNEWLQFKRVTPAAATTNKATPIGKKLVVNG
jgi:hypothetical protein